MRRRLVFLSLLMIVALASAGCLNMFNKPVKVSGTVTVAGDAPGDLDITVSVIGSAKTAKVAADGTFELELMPGKYQLLVAGEGVKQGSLDIVVQKNRPLTGLEIDLEPVEADKFYLAFDVRNDDHLALLQKPWDSVEWEVKADWFGDLNWYFPRGKAEYAPPAGVYNAMRFAYFDTPDLDTFRISLEQLGDGPVTATAPGGNRSLSFVFGYQDMKNWWVAYYTYTDATRVARIVDGTQVYVCRPQITGQWWPNNDKYQHAEIVLERDGDEYVLRSYANGEPTSIDGCRFPADEFTPGKIGLGGHSTSDVQAWWFRNVVIEEL